MDCREIQQLLEAVRPDTDDLLLPEITVAEQHLASCLDCQEAFQKISSFDRIFGAAIRNVSLPVGLNQRVLAAVALQSVPSESPAIGDAVENSSDFSRTENNVAGDVSAADSNTESVHLTSGESDIVPAPARPVSRRRAMQWIAATSAALLLSVSAFWLWPTKWQQSPIEELLSGFGAQADNLQNPFDKNFAASLPQDGWDSRQLRLEGPFGYTDAVHKSTADLGAIYQFRLMLSPGNTLSGRLLVIPASRISNPPPASSMLEVAAVSSTDGNYSSAAWSEGDLVFICVVDGHAGNFSALQRALAPQLG